MKRPWWWYELTSVDIEEEKVMKEELPEMTIQCPACNDREHMVTIYIFPHRNRITLSCDKCGTQFNVKSCRIVEKIELARVLT